MTQEPNTTVTVKAEPKGMTAAEVLRALRKFLPPGSTKRTDSTWPGYYYPGKLMVELYGVCSFRATTEERDACRIVKVVVRPSATFAHTVWQKGLSVRTFRSKKDGTFSSETIGAAIQSMLKEIEALARTRAANDAAKLLEQTKADELRAEMAAFLSERGFQGDIFLREGSNSLAVSFQKMVMGTEKQEPYLVGPAARIRNGSNSFNIHLEGLTFQQAKIVLLAIKPPFTPKRAKGAPRARKGKRS